MKVVVHNTDGVNPYAVEVTALLARDPSAQVVLVDAANSDHRPPGGVRWRRVLPENFTTSGRGAQAGRALRGLGETVWASARGHVVVVAWYRFPMEALAFAALAAAGRPVVFVDHNPVPRVHESRATRFARRALLQRAKVVVVHAERLRPQVDPIASGAIVVCPHPPYLESAPPPGGVAAPLDADLRWLAFIGRMRRDKGIHLLPGVLERVPESRRRRLGLVLCGMGEVPADIRAALHSLGMTVREIVSEDPVPEATLHAVLAARPLVLAPYVAATQSGSVILALSMGCQVLAFDKGGIPDVLASDGLVPIDDLDAFAEAVSQDRGGASVLPLTEWAARAAEAWSGAVVLASAAPPRQ